MTTQPYTIATSQARLISIPVDPPRGDAIQKFDALELSMVWVTDLAGNTGVGFGYTIGKAGTAILGLLRWELLPEVEGKDSFTRGRRNPETGKRRNLSTFDTKKEAEKHEQEVQYFKRKG